MSGKLGKLRLPRGSGRLSLTRGTTASAHESICHDALSIPGRYRPLLHAGCAACPQADRESPRDKTLDVTKHAALAAMLNMILNLDEVMTKE
jgi:hypothetical protein